nr:hypothetical protein [uncultured Cohaesibacter sp.]
MKAQSFSFGAAAIVLLFSLTGCNEVTSNQQPPMESAALPSLPENEPLAPSQFGPTSHEQVATPQPSYGMAQGSSANPVTMPAAPVNKTQLQPAATERKAQPAPLPPVISYVLRFTQSPLPAWQALPPQKAQKVSLKQEDFFKMSMNTGLHVPVFKKSGRFVQILSKTNGPVWVREFDVMLPPEKCVEGRGLNVGGRGGNLVSSGLSHGDIICK